MRVKLLTGATTLGGIATLGALLSLQACGSDSSTPSDDGSSSSSSGGSSSGGSSSGGSSSGGSSSSSGGSSGNTDGGTDGGTTGPQGTSLKTGNVVLLGVTSDATPHAVYIVVGATNSLEAAPLAGGAPVVISATFATTDRVAVRGGAVAYWTGVTNSIGTLNVWTKANGAKTAISTTSRTGFFSASKDGARIAFSVGASATSTDLAVTTSATPAATAVLTGNAAINLAAAVGAGGNPASCAPQIGFAGQVLFAAYCTGTAANATAGRLYTVPAASTTPTRLDAAANAGNSVIPYWSADDAGTKVFTINSNAASAGRVIVVATGQPGATLDNNTEDGFMLPDASAVIYKTNTTFTKATAVATPVKTQLLANGVTINGLLDVARDNAHIMFNSLAPAGANELVDIRTIDTTTATQTPVDVVATAITSPFGFNAAGTHALYFGDISGAGAKLKAKPITAGGAEVVLSSDAVGLDTPPTGKGALLFTNPKKVGQITTLSLSWLADATKTGTPSAIATDVADGQYDFSGTKLVYATQATTGAGLYVYTLP